MAKPTNEPREHHFVPQFWLGGFTDTGKRDGLLWATGLRRKKQWQCKPSRVGSRRDYNRVVEPGLPNPLVIEHLYSRIEGQVARIFRLFYEERRGPRSDIEFGTALEYMAIQWTRLPVFRATLDRAVLSNYFRDVLSKEEEAQTASQWKLSPEVHLDNEQAKLVNVSSGAEITFSAKPDFYIQQIAKFLEPIYECLRQMQWAWLESADGQYLASDSPICVLHAPRDEPNGFLDADMITYPLNRFVLLIGSREPLSGLEGTPEVVARLNTIAMLNAEEQIYSHRADFDWLGPDEKVRTDWFHFTKADFPGQLQITRQ